MKKLLTLSSALAIIIGITMVVGGVWGICFTYTNVATEKIITPADATIPNKPVRGPFTLRAQAEIIRKHALAMTGGKTYAEMPRQIPEVDSNGTSVLDNTGKPVMVYNTARDIWVTVTTLTTALNFAVITYAFSAFIILFGLISIWTGVVFWALKNR